MKIKKDKTDLFLVFLIFFLSTRASGISQSNFILFGSLLCNVAIAVSRRVKIDKSFVVFIIFLLIIFLQNYIRLGEYFDVLRYLKLLSLIFTAYLTIKIVRFSFFTYLNKIVIYAIVLSLPFYMWQLVSVDSFHNVGKSLNGIFSGLMDVSIVVNNPSLNILFYNIEFVENFRNAGPMWEPGGFAAVIVLTFFFELLQNDYRFNKRSWIYLLGIFITFSTTGYMATLIVLFFYLTKKARLSSSKYSKPLLYFLLPAFLVIAGIIFFNTPIFYQKIMSQLGSQNEVIANISDYGDTFKSLGRFGSLQVDFNSIQDKLIFGRGYTDENFRMQYENFNFTNGLSNFAGRMGLVGLCWLIISLFKSGKLIFYGLSGSHSGSFIFTLLIVIISFSNPVLLTPLFMVLQLFFIPFKIQLNAKNQPGDSEISS